MAAQDAFCPNCGELARWHNSVIACNACAKSFQTWTANDNAAAPDVLSYAGERPPRGRPVADRSANAAVGFALFWWLLPLMPIGAMYYGLKSLTRFPRGVRYVGRRRAIASVIVGVLTLLVAWPWLWVKLSELRSWSASFNCAMRAREVGQLVHMFHSDNRRTPNTFSEALQTWPDAIVCPSDSVRQRHLKQGTLLTLPWQEQSSYVYLGQGIPMGRLKGGEAYLPMLFEPIPPHEHPLILFADGHVERPPTADALRMIQSAEDQRHWRDHAPTTQEAP